MQKDNISPKNYSFEFRKSAGFMFIVSKQAEKAKHDEKEMKKLQDSFQSLQLRLAAREHICRSLQEKVMNSTSVCFRLTSKEIDIYKLIFT